MKKKEENSREALKDELLTMLSEIVLEDYSNIPGDIHEYVWQYFLERLDDVISHYKVREKKTNKRNYWLVE